MLEHNNTCDRDMLTMYLAQMHLLVLKIGKTKEIIHVIHDMQTLQNTIYIFSRACKYSSLELVFNAVAIDATIPQHMID